MESSEIVTRSEALEANWKWRGTNSGTKHRKIFKNCNRMLKTHLFRHTVLENQNSRTMSVFKALKIWKKFKGFQRPAWALYYWYIWVSRCSCDLHFL